MKRKFSDFFPALRHLNIPNAITTFGMILGIAACYFLTQQNLRVAVVLLFFAGVMDAVDGFVAAKLNQQTEFGQYVDTLVDFFICGIMPIWMVFDLFVNTDYSRFDEVIIVVGLVFYSLCALWRLAYYNVIEAEKYFTGLPVPGAMMVVTIAIWFVKVVGFPMWVAAAAFLIIGTLMVSGIQLKKYGLWQKAMGVVSLPFLALVIFYTG